MKLKSTSLLILVLFVSVYETKDLILGDRLNNVLVSTQKVVVSSIPFIRREKDYVYQDPRQNVISGIIVRDLSRTKGEVTVTDGGLGKTHVTLHLKGERGEGLNYLILIFGKNR